MSVSKTMIELTQNTKTEPISNDIVQLSHIKGDTIFMTDPEGSQIEIRTTKDRKIVFTKDNQGHTIAIENRNNGTRLYHISSDATGLPSSHEIRKDKTEIVYFYNQDGKVQHLVELKPNGDRISTIIMNNGSLYSIEQKQIGGIIFQAWLRSEDKEPKEGMIWLHPDGELSIHGNTSVICDLKARFSKFLDGVTV